jgi:hypothetical protein
LLLVFALSGWTPAAANHVGTPVSGDVAACSVRATTFNIASSSPGTTYEAWASCTTISTGTTFTNPQSSTLSIAGELKCNGTTQGTEWFGGRDAGSNGVIAKTFADGNTHMRIHYTDWEWVYVGQFGGCSQPITMGYDVAGDSDSIAYVNFSGSSGVQVADDPTTRAAGHGMRLVDKLTGGTGYPEYPTSSGGSGTQPDPTTTCGVDLTSGDGVYRAVFKNTVTNTVSGVTDTYAWAFGDTGTSTTQSPTHVYATPTASGGGKWTATVTTTRPGANNTDVCTIVFDFFGPSHVDGDSGDSEPQPDDTEETEDGCSLWPHKFIVCWMKKLFIPSGTFVEDQFEEWHDLALEQWPAAPVVWFVDTMSDAQTGLASGDAPDWLPVRSNDGCGSWVDLPLPLVDGDVHVPLLPTHSEGCGGDMDQLMTKLRQLVFAISTLGGVYLVASGVYYAAYGLFGEKTTPHGDS